MLLSLKIGQHLVGFVLGSFAGQCFKLVIKGGKRLLSCSHRRFGVSWGRKKDNLGSLHLEKSFSVRVK